MPFLEKARVENSGNVKLRQFHEYIVATYLKAGDIQPVPDQPITEETLEALVFGPQRDNRLPFTFIERAYRTARSVARLTVPRIFNGVADGSAVYGTGWIIAPGVLMTNHHVIDARNYRFEQPAQQHDFEAQAQRVVVRFDYHMERMDGVYFECRNATLLAANRDLDYAVIELAEPEKVVDREPLPVLSADPGLSRGTRVNIVQHSGGDPMLFAIRNNFFVKAGARPSRLLYQTDTEPGASGSAVCNDRWEVIALHHASVAIAPELVPQEVIDGNPVTVKLLNEAIRMADILNDLPPALRQRIAVV
jgi:V8-like Glu-specific endopeptidase